MNKITLLANKFEKYAFVSKQNGQDPNYLIVDIYSPFNEKLTIKTCEETLNVSHVETKTFDNIKVKDRIVSKTSLAFISNDSPLEKKDRYLLSQKLFDLNIDTFVVKIVDALPLSFFLK